MTGETQYLLYQRVKKLRLFTVGGNTLFLKAFVQITAAVPPGQGLGQIVDED
jgi:hypothetical protein